MNVYEECHKRVGLGSTLCWRPGIHGLGSWSGFTLFLHPFHRIRIAMPIEGSPPIEQPSFHIRSSAVHRGNKPSSHQRCCTTHVKEDEILFYFGINMLGLSGVGHLWNAGATILFNNGSLQASSAGIMDIIQTRRAKHGKTVPQKKWVLTVSCQYQLMFCTSAMVLKQSYHLIFVT